MDMNKDLNINYIKYGIILVVIVIISIGSTLAYYSWGSTANTNFSIEVLADVIRIMYDGGPDITGANLFPTDDKENDGIKKEITVSVDRYSEYASYNLYLDLKTLPDALTVLPNGQKNQSFRYEFYRGNTLINSGDFGKPMTTTSTCTKNNTNHIVLVSNVTPTTTPVTYTLYIWIDGENYENPDIMMNQSFEFTLHADGENVTDGTSISGGSGGSGGTTLALGDYVSYTPTKTSATVNKAQTGYTGTQAAIKPSELKLWRVLEVNADGTVDLISEYVSSTVVYFQGLTGYKNYVGELNRLASQYETSGITVGSRYFGYNNQTEFITDTSKFVNPPPWTVSTSDNSNESSGGGDILYLKDFNQLNTALGTRVAYKVGTTTATTYLMASRDYYYSSSTSYFWYGRCVNTSGAANRNFLYYYNKTSFNTFNYSYALRPIVTLGSGLQYTGEGTSGSPYVIAS